MAEKNSNPIDLDNITEADWNRWNSENYADQVAPSSTFEIVRDPKTGLEVLIPSAAARLDEQEETRFYNKQANIKKKQTQKTDREKDFRTVSGYEGELKRIVTSLFHYHHGESEFYIIGIESWYKRQEQKLIKAVKKLTNMTDLDFDDYDGELRGDLAAVSTRLWAQEINDYKDKLIKLFDDKHAPDKDVVRDIQKKINHRINMITQIKGEKFDFDYAKHNDDSELVFVYEGLKEVLAPYNASTSRRGSNPKPYTNTTRRGGTGYTPSENYSAEKGLNLEAKVQKPKPILPKNIQI